MKKNSRNRIRSVLLFALLMETMLVLPGCVSPHAKQASVAVQPQVVQTMARFRKEYVFAPGDQIEVVVRRVPEASRTVQIRLDGDISLPIVHDVKLAGLSSSEATDRLTNLLSARLVKPEVTVIPIQVRQPMVYVVGDINNGSGIAVPFRDAPTALQAITLAGGLKKSGSAKNISIIRLSDEGYLQALPVVSKTGGQPGPYMALSGTLLQPDDIVFVPETGRSQVVRFLNDVVNTPMVGVNAVVGSYLNFKLVTKIQ